MHGTEMWCDGRTVHGVGEASRASRQHRCRLQRGRGAAKVRADAHPMRLMLLVVRLDEVQVVEPHSKAVLVLLRAANGS